MPLADGRPALEGGQVVRAERGGDVLAVLVRGGAVPGLYFISISSCSVIGVFPHGRLLHSGTFSLSRDGRRFAVLSGKGELEVREVSGEQTAIFVAPKEEVAIHFASLGRSCLLVREVDEANRHVRDRCLIRWDRGRIEVERDQIYSVFSRLGGVLAQSRSLRPGDAEINRTQIRFVGVIEEGRLRILIDRYNHFVVFDSRGNLVCIFYVIRDEVGALLVDGTYWGSPRLIGRDGDCRARPSASAGSCSKPKDYRRAGDDDPCAITARAATARPGCFRPVCSRAESPSELFALCTLFNLDPSGRVFARRRRTAGHARTAHDRGRAGRSSPAEALRGSLSTRRCGAGAGPASPMKRPAWFATAAWSSCMAVVCWSLTAWRRSIPGTFLKPADSRRRPWCSLPEPDVPGRAAEPDRARSARTGSR